MNGPAAVYKIYNANGALLYVGCTVDPEVRMAAHAHQAPWRSEWDHHSVVWFDHHNVALQVEAFLIWRDQPMYNIKGRRCWCGSPCPQCRSGCYPHHRRYSPPDHVCSDASIGIGADATSPVHDYIQVASQLRAAIRSGEYTDMLPSLSTIARKLCKPPIAVTTAQHALRVLKDEGVVYSVRGKGTFVAGRS